MAFQAVTRQLASEVTSWKLIFRHACYFVLYGTPGILDRGRFKRVASCWPRNLIGKAEISESAADRRDKIRAKVMR